MLKQIITIIAIVIAAASCSTGKKTTDTNTAQKPADNQTGVHVQKVNTTIPPANNGTQKTEVLYDK